jgi:hypothetical protein
MRALGTELPSFRLPDVATQELISSTTLAGRPSVIAFICNHCPFVKHIKPALADFGRYCRDNGVPMVAISSNDAESYPDDGPERMAEEVKTFGFVFPYLYDEDQSVARSFDAECTPEFFVFDAAAKLASRGQFDASRPNNGIPVTGDDLRAAVAALLEGRAPSADQKPSIGCNIKWKAGNAPQ